jgi:tetratricopeptide (TPR) repeat protein
LFAPIAVLAQDDAHDAEAHAMFEAGRIAFADGRFSDALSSFQRAYDLSHRPALLYNIGQCHDRMRQDSEALTAFEQFLSLVPDAPQAAEVRGRVAFIREAAAHATPATPTEPPPTHEATPPPTEPPPATSSNDPGVVPWVLIGTGAGVAIAGAVLLGVGYGDISSVQNAADGVRYSTVRDADQQAPVLTGVGFACLAVGVAAAVVGVVLFATSSSHAPEEAHATMRLGPTGLVLQGAF